MQSPSRHTPLDTTPLRRMVEMFVQLSLVIVEEASGGDVTGRAMGRALRRAVQYSRMIARLSREIARSDIQNMRSYAMARLREDESWRIKIRGELGGYHVIERWRRRFACQFYPAQIERRRAREAHLEQLKSQAPTKAPIASSTSVQPQTSDTAARKPYRATTDSSGLFRLAPVPMWLEAHNYLKIPNAPRVQRGPRDTPVTRALASFTPIALQPSDLEITIPPTQEVSEKDALGREVCGDDFHERFETVREAQKIEIVNEFWPDNKTNDEIKDEGDARENWQADVPPRPPPILQLPHKNSMPRVRLI